MRILAISDIHGCHKELNDLLRKVDYDKNSDRLILLGDYVDRGQFSKQVLDRVIDLVKGGAIALRGNHDQLFLNWLLREEEDELLDQHYMSNGGFMTILSYVGPNWFDSGLEFDRAKKFILRNYNHHVEFLNSLPYYYEVEDYIFVHAGINPEYECWKDTPSFDMMWIREEFLECDTGLSKVVVHGHTPTYLLTGSSDIYFRKDKIGIDGSLCFSGRQLNCLEIDGDSLIEHCVKK